MKAHRGQRGNAEKHDHLLRLQNLLWKNKKGHVALLVQMKAIFAYLVRAKDKACPNSAVAQCGVTCLADRR